jgi:predicted ATP-dependent protease
MFYFFPSSTNMTDALKQVIAKVAAEMAELQEQLEREEKEEWERVEREEREAVEEEATRSVQRSTELEETRGKKRTREEEAEEKCKQCTQRRLDCMWEVKGKSSYEVQASRGSRGRGSSEEVEEDGDGRRVEVEGKGTDGRNGGEDSDLHQEVPMEVTDWSCTRRYRRSKGEYGGGDNWSAYEADINDEAEIGKSNSW